MAPFVKNLFGNPVPKLVNFGKTSKTEFADKYESLFQNTFLKPQDSVFVNKALTVSHTTLYHQPQINLIEKKQGWFYVSEKHVGQRVDSQLPGIVLEPIKPNKLIAMITAATINTKVDTPFNEAKLAICSNTPKSRPPKTLVHFNKAAKINRIKPIKNIKRFNINNK
jgi:hypothetical protein